LLWSEVDSVPTRDYRIIDGRVSFLELQFCAF
jgi:hypothetical protein